MNADSDSSDAGLPPPLHRWLGRCDYQPVWDAMRDFTDTRGETTADQFWTLDHESVFTLGQAADSSHVLAPGDIPVIQTDRGGQVTYHGPGQLMVYCLVDINRLGIGVRALVSALETSVIGMLSESGIGAAARPDAPGIYVDGAKIGSLGLRVRRGFAYHGLALNCDVDLEPFDRINPCGFRNMAMTRTADLGGPADIATARDQLLPHLLRNLRLPAITDLADAEH